MTNNDGIYTCRMCGKNFVPSFAEDFYPDPGADITMGRCEQCFMRGASAVPAGRPVEISSMTFEDPISLALAEKGRQTGNLDD